VRHLTGNDAVKAKPCLGLLQTAQRGEVTLTTSEIVIAWVVYVLSSGRQGYGLSPGEIRQRLYPLLLIPGLRLTHRKAHLRALDLYASHPIDFEDTMVAAHLERQKIGEIFGHDRHFDRLSQVTRLEP
jgi:predicted nucleic acid-binding protein